MRQTKTEWTGEFIASETAAGSTASKYTHYQNVRTLHDDQDQWQPTRKSLRLPDGDPVNMVSDGVYEIARSGEQLKR